MFLKFSSRDLQNLESKGASEPERFGAKLAQTTNDDKSAAFDMPSMAAQTDLNESKKSGGDFQRTYDQRKHSHVPSHEISTMEVRTNGKGILRLSSHGRSTAKSKAGCLTCKYRKKKCDETKPVCHDCRRFNKECVWADHRSMNGAEIERLKVRVREQESSRKLRKRFNLPKVTSSMKKADISSSASPEPRVSLDNRAHELSVPNFYHGISDTQPLSGHRYATLTSGSYSPVNSDLRDSSAPKANCAGPTKKSEPEPEPEEVKSRSSDNEYNYTQGYQALVYPKTFSPYGSFSDREPEATTNIEANPDHHNIPSTSFCHNSESHASFPVFNFLKEWSSFNSSNSNILHSINDANVIDQSHLQTDPQKETSELENSSVFGEDTAAQESTTSRLSPSLSIFNFLEQMNNITYEYPAQLTNLASAFNATFSVPPQISLSPLPELDQSGLYLYKYYSEVLSSKVCIAPNSQDDSNSYRNVFLPLAQRDKGVLYGILAWAGFHLGGQWLLEGSKYAELAFKSLCKDIDFNMGSQMLEDRRKLIHKLAAILIMCGAEICRGDVKFWPVYLEWGWKLLRDNGGILNFNNNKEEHWLISNFAYHDLLASSTSNRGTYFPSHIYDRIFLDPEGISAGNINPLLGVSKPLYKVIGDISSLFFESKSIMSDYYKQKHTAPKVTEVLAATPDSDSPSIMFADSASETSDHTRMADMLSFISNKARELENTLNNAKPNASDLQGLSARDFELQLTTFEAFQLSCKLYLRQAILKLNPSALECQILMNDLIKCLDVLIDTPMQATLAFPLFIAGVFTVTESGKAAMRDRYDVLISEYGPWNVVRVKSLVEIIWRENPHGDSVVDWNALLNNLDWDLNFA